MQQASSPVTDLAQRGGHIACDHDQHDGVQAEAQVLQACRVEQVRRHCQPGDREAAPDARQALQVQ
jgi:hypothetical protein